MLNFDFPKPLIIIIGPTAVGKTDLAIELARSFQGEVISADSRYLYRGMDIGTAKPTLAEQQSVPHHMIDVAEPDEIWSLAEFQTEAYRIIDEIHSRGKPPILVGGTGQYVRAIVEGWQIPPQAPDGRLRDSLARWGEKIGAAALHRKLSQLDRMAAENIEPNNMRRTIRAFEVIFLTGERFSVLRSRQACPYSVLQVGLKRSREELYQRIDQRIEIMVNAGMLEETAALREKGYSPDMPSMSAIGYREMYAVLEGEMSMEEAVMLMKRYTRQFVRKQANWFKESDSRINWFDVGQVSCEDIVEFIKSGQGWLSLGSVNH